MKSRVLLIALFWSFIVIKCFAQTGNSVQNLHTAKLTFLGLSYSYEHAIGKQTVLNGELKLATGFGSNMFLNEGNVWYVVYPTLRVEPRYYYNYLKRAGKGKKTVNNTANYLALSVNKNFNSIINSSEINVIREFSVIPKWGLKRSLGQHFVFETAIGVGYRYDQFNRARVSPGFDLQFGYAF